MKILYVTHAYPPHGSGVGSFVQEVARGLVARGHQVWVVETYHPSHGAPVGDRMDEGVDVRVFGKRFLPFRWLRADTAASRTLLRLAHKTKIFFLLLLLQSWRCGRWVRRLAAKLDVDVVEVPDGNESGLLGVTQERSALVVRIHGSVHLQMASGVKAFSSTERWIYRRIERGLMRRADAIVAVSAFVGHLAENLFALPHTVPVIYNLAPASPPGLPQKHDAPEVLFVGRIGSDKGVDTLGKAWNLIAPRFPEVKLVVLGVGDTALLTQPMSTDARAQVVLEGSVSKEQVLEHMGACRVFVLPSRYESFSIALLEALAMGCPTICTERCSGPEIIDNGVDGFLINPDDAEALATAMMRLLSDGDLRQRMSAAALEKATRFGDRAAWLDTNEQFYLRAVESRAAAQDVA